MSHYYFLQNPLKGLLVLAWLIVKFVFMVISTVIQVIFAAISEFIQGFVYLTICFFKMFIPGRQKLSEEPPTQTPEA